MTGLTGGPDRRLEGVDRDINAARRARDRCRLQIDEYLGAVVSLRRKYARVGLDIDVLLDERLALATAATSPPEGLDAHPPTNSPDPVAPDRDDVRPGDAAPGHHGQG